MPSTTADAVPNHSPHPPFGASIAEAELDRALALLCRHSPAAPPARLQAALMLRFGMTQHQMARAIRRQPEHTSRVVNGGAKSRALLKLIAGFMHLKVSDIWPPADDSEVA